MTAPTPEATKIKNVLLTSAKSGDLVLLKLLLDAGADIESKNHELSPPLYLAAANQHLDLVKYLVEKKAEINGRNLWIGQTPLWVAAFNDDLTMVEYLVSVNADVDAKERWGRTPLHMAAWKNNIDMAKLLLSSGADIEAKDDDGLTPLHYAAMGIPDGKLVHVQVPQPIHIPYTNDQVSDSFTRHK